MKRTEFTQEKREIAARCLDMVADAMTSLTEHGQGIQGLIVFYTTLRQWLVKHDAPKELRAVRAEIVATRRVLDDATSSKAAGADRLDASLRATVAWMLWRSVELMLGEHDETAEVWCRMGLAQVRARYEGVAPTFGADDGDDDKASLPTEVTTT